MSTFWSKEIQSSEILYYSRFARFNDYNKDEWFRLLQITNGIKVLEIGCGTGQSTLALLEEKPERSAVVAERIAPHLSQRNIVRFPIISILSFSFQ